MNIDTDVLIVGAGPAGLTLACDLRRRGVDLRVVSAAPGGFEGSRAKGIQPRTVEVLDDLGVLTDLEQDGTLYPKLGLHLGPLTIPKTMIKIHEVTEDVPHPNTLLVAQYDTDAALRRRLVELGGSVEFDTRFVSHSAADDIVVATVERADSTTVEVRTRYLVGADGGASTVRQGCGIDFPGTTDDKDRMIVADLTADGLSRDRWHIWPRHAGRFMALCPLPDGKWQLMLKLRPDESADLDPETVSEMVRTFVGKADVTIAEIHWASVWRPNIRLAERYRDGRVFLIGDAAHVHPPTGGQGMNTGIQDAYNLGWKLAGVLNGADDTLLDTYQSERQPVAASVLGLSSELYAKMSDRPLAAAKRGDEERQLQLSYRGGPLANLGDNEPEPRSGDRAPDAGFLDGDGHRTNLHETFRGPHFTLLAIGTGAADVATSLDWPGALGDLRTVVIPQPSEGIKRIYGITDPLLVLVRPDGYIAARERVGSPGPVARFLGLVASSAA